MKTNIAIGYSITITILIILTLVWRAGYNSGKTDTIERVESVLSNEIKKPMLGGTFDAILDEFENELQ